MKNKALVEELKKRALELPKAPAEAFDAVAVSCQKCCSASSGGNGVASFVSPTSRSRTGSFVFTVTDVSLGGYGYMPATNTETSDSIAR